ncbi:glycoside hydrolase family 31 protein [Exidia glandulosa HHB12029]|uniref:Glycoside hydrolase family 31 protein n=1 Tax=Exidia glandulosa HHB12029 TaxID=1314781 RepID=A0A165EIY9_EXIGL|nr:glycoside hydrolase family 31 protein [Exidia glandulosa HHB12029]
MTSWQRVDIDGVYVGYTGHLAISGPACNAFGRDYADLTVEVVYESASRLRVSILDTAESQFRIPESVIERPKIPRESFVDSSDLVFNFVSTPTFEFWITRRDDPTGIPLFDTRIASLPPTPIPPVIPEDESTALRGFPLVFEDQYLQITSALPYGANIYGLGEAWASSGFRRDVGSDGGRGTVQALWSRDAKSREDKNTSAGGDALLLTPPKSNVSLVQYRMIGGVLDFYFVAGPSPIQVIEQYSEIVGKPAWMPYWSLGFHLCRRGDDNLNDTKAHVARMRDENIPLEVMWNALDLYHDYRAFTTDPERFPIAEHAAFIRSLVSDPYVARRHRPLTQIHVEDIPLIDPYIATQNNDTDIYYPYLSGVEQNIFVTNPDSSMHLGRARAGTIAFPDWFAQNTQSWWTDAFRNWSATGIDFDGLWIDKSFPNSKYCSPAYGKLGYHTMETNATHAPGYIELDVHNLFGLMEARGTYETLRALRPGERPFVMSRSTFPSSGRWAAHWLGDNHSIWADMYKSIAGVLQFQIFQMPMVGADACGFNGNSTEELCNRWMQLAAFHPFYRNHNDRNASPHEPYRWESVAEATRVATKVRYQLLPYWYTLMVNASRYGTPPVRALWFEFPDEEDLFNVDRQFLVGRDILVTPVLEPGAVTVKGIFPGLSSGTVWRDRYTHQLVPRNSRTVTLDAPLGHINVHVRSGAALLLHATPGYTLSELRNGSYEIVVVLDEAGFASGKVYLDDGLSDPPGAHTYLHIEGRRDFVELVTRPSRWTIVPALQTVTVLGVKARPVEVHLRVMFGPRKALHNWTYEDELQRLVVNGLRIDLNWVVSELRWT